MRKKTLWLCFWRTWSIGAAMSTRGMQRVGILHALDPALQSIHTSPAMLQAARRRYLGNVRTHTVFASLLIGLCIALERDGTAQRMQNKSFEQLLFTTATTLSAIGDSFFSGSLVAFWALLCGQAILWEIPALVVALTVLFGLFIFFFRAYMFFMGVKRGLPVLQLLRKLNLINCADGLKMCNAVLIAVFLGKMCTHVYPWYYEILALLCLLGVAFIIHTLHISRLFLLTICLLAFILFSRVGGLYAL